MRVLEQGKGQGIAGEDGDVLELPLLELKLLKVRHDELPREHCTGIFYLEYSTFRL